MRRVRPTRRRSKWPDQREKFLFYRGVGNFTVPLSARLSGNGQVTATSSNAQAAGRHHALREQGRDDQVQGAAVEGSRRSRSRCRRARRASMPFASRLWRRSLQRGLFAKEAVGDGRDLARLLVRGRAAALLHRRSPRCRRYPAARSHAGAGGCRARICRPHRAHHSVSYREVRAALEAGDKAAVRRYGRFLRPILQRISETIPATARGELAAPAAVRPDVGLAVAGRLQLDQAVAASSSAARAVSARVRIVSKVSSFRMTPFSNTGSRRSFALPQRSVA